MSKHYFDCSQDEKMALIRQTAALLDISDIMVEKDIWICWALEQIFSLPVQMSFKGGTSLSKVFHLIKRFSEDCDVTIDYRNFKPDLDLEKISRSQLKKVSDELKVDLRHYIATTVIPHLEKHASHQFKDKVFNITLSDDGEQLRFYYPTVIDAQHRYLRDHVLVEFGVRNTTEPCEQYPIVPYLVKLNNKDILLPTVMVNTLSPIRTFWEKGTLIHVECYRFEKSVYRLSRHWYDLYMLHHSWVGKEALKNNGILLSVIDHKKAFFNASYAHYDDCLKGNFRLIPEGNYLKNLEQDYSKMIDAGMFYERPPKFDAILENLGKLEEKINREIRY